MFYGRWRQPDWAAVCPRLVSGGRELRLQELWFRVTGWKAAPCALVEQRSGTCVWRAPSFALSGLGSLGDRQGRGCSPRENGCCPHQPLPHGTGQHRGRCGPFMSRQSCSEYFTHRPHSLCTFAEMRRARPRGRGAWSSGSEVRQPGRASGLFTVGPALL